MSAVAFGWCLDGNHSKCRGRYADTWSNSKAIVVCPCCAAGHKREEAP